jgi:hypothetical protein
MNNWNFRDETYGDKENRRRAQMRRAEKAEAAYARLDEGQNVRTPAGSALSPRRTRTASTSTRPARSGPHEVEPTDGGSSGVSL